MSNHLLFVCNHVLTAAMVIFCSCDSRSGSLSMAAKVLYEELSASWLSAFAHSTAWYSW